MSVAQGHSVAHGAAGQVKWRNGLLVGLALAVGATGSACGGAAASKPAGGTAMSVAQIAAYQKPDRLKILEAGARAEGQLTYYTTNANTGLRHELISGFEKQYPYLKVQVYRADTPTLLSRLLAEYRAHKYVPDALELDPIIVGPVAQAGILQTYYSPSVANIEPSAVTSKGGLTQDALSAFVGLGVGWNTKLVPAADAPTGWQSLLNPFFKGKIVVPNSSSTVNWIGDAVTSQGQAYVEKLKGQNIHVVSGSGLAIANMVATGQYALTPIYYNTFYKDAKKKGQPVDWLALQPMYATAFAWCLPVHSQHPYAAMLFIDYALSHAGLKAYADQGYFTTEKGASSLGASFKLFMPGTMKDYQQQYKRWQGLLQQITQQ